LTPDASSMTSSSSSRGAGILTSRAPNEVYRPRHRARCSGRFRRFAQQNLRLLSVSPSLQMKTPIESHGKDQVWWTSTWVQVCLSMFPCWIVPAWVKLSHIKPIDFFLQLSGPHASGICSSSKVASLGRGTCMSKIL
jgi:hypothetical protein